jgi:hypothetical protein
MANCAEEYHASKRFIHSGVSAVRVPSQPFEGAVWQYLSRLTQMYWHSEFRADMLRQLQAEKCTT